MGIIVLTTVRVYLETFEFRQHEDCLQGDNIVLELDFSKCLSLHLKILTIVLLSQRLTQPAFDYSIHEVWLISFSLFPLPSLLPVDQAKACLRPACHSLTRRFAG